MKPTNLTELYPIRSKKGSELALKLAGYFKVSVEEIFKLENED